MNVLEADVLENVIKVEVTDLDTGQVRIYEQVTQYGWRR